ncbi:NAD(P)-dependent oxidoreductase [Acrocarpospora pleiomorpha]|uniref:dTDP-4-dehydrorhamnose reductase n=1 Tax=Acrocarpospora pleiomorpha TaxID=90975 RepID=A0A5M3Y4H9_9ACTN|nr:dTDP-4-dehydrorhamnose reductase [Acrocarpospora pleiomorpha]GES25888.1 NAD(P)-dependent oxidoreductase [Acrocarpospora pleiomorpha]
MNPTWLVTGAGGMLGADVVEALTRDGEQVAALGRGELDLTDPDAVAVAVRDLNPQVVINCAAWTAVDDAETHEPAALAVNGHAVRSLAAACGPRLLHVSTDYVFAGTGSEPYREDEATDPVNAYGRTKLAGERAVLAHGGTVVRTAWLYGAHGPNFARTMIRLAGSQDQVTVVDDQFGQPTWTADLAERLLQLGRTRHPGGIYHGTSQGRTSWHGFAQEIFRLLGADPDRVVPIPSARFPRPARRPANSVLGHDRWAAADLPPIRDWRAGLAAAWSSLNPVAQPASDR